MFPSCDLFCNFEFASGAYLTKNFTLAFDHQISGAGCGVLMVLFAFRFGESL
jgi:hypothetical protein